MILSRETLLMLFEIGAPPEKMAALLKSIDADMLAFQSPADAAADQRREKDRARKRVRRIPRTSTEVGGLPDVSADPLPQSEEPASSFNTECNQTPNPPPYKPPALSQISAFERFWDAYPHKVKKRGADGLFPSAMKRAGGLEVILAGVERAKRSRQWVEGYVPEPARWLRNDCWLDEPEEAARAPPATGGMVAAAAREAGLRMAIEQRERRNGRDDLEGGASAVVALPRFNQISR